MNYVSYARRRLSTLDDFICSWLSCDDPIVESLWIIATADPKIQIDNLSSKTENMSLKA